MQAINFIYKEEIMNAVYIKLNRKLLENLILIDLHILQGKRTNKNSEQSIAKRKA